LRSAHKDIFSVRAGDFLTRALLATVLSAAVTSAHAQYKDSYARGLEAYKDGKLTEAKAYFQSAFNEHPEPALRIQLYGKRFEPYVPQHYLGLIAAAEHDCATLQVAQNSAASEQVAAQLPDVAKLPSGISGCAQIAKKDDTGIKPPVADTGKSATTGKPDVATNKPSQTTDTASTGKKTAPPEALQRALDDFVLGHYESAARVDPAALTDARARFHAYLVRAAAEYTLSRLADDGSAALARARTAAGAARALDRQTTPDESLFSPAFRKFYASAR
jgi:hypothetical protein